MLGHYSMVTLAQPPKVPEHHFDMFLCLTLAGLDCLLAWLAWLGLVAFPWMGFAGFAIQLSPVAEATMHQVSR